MNNTEFDSKICHIRILSSNIMFGDTLAGRIPLIGEYYRDSDADIIGVQEMGKPGLALYSSLADIYTPVATHHGEEKRCYTPIFYRTERFDLLESGCEVHRMRANDTKSFAWVVLKDKKTEKKLAYINTHSAIICAWYQGATDSVEGEEWRVDNIRQMLEKKGEFIQKYGQELAVFIGGDFNAKPHHSSVQLMKQFMTDSADIATEKATRGIKSYHGIPGRPCEAGEPIDFVFVDPDRVEVLTHTIMSDERSLSISDHCPVCVEAVLK